MQNPTIKLIVCSSVKRCDIINADVLVLVFFCFEIRFVCFERVSFFSNLYIYYILE